jgi:hypothetical protein
MLAPDLGRMALTPKQVPEHNRALYQRKHTYPLSSGAIACKASTNKELVP